MPPKPRAEVIIQGCTVADGPALAHNNVPAFWQDTNWVIGWRHTTQDAVVSSFETRIARNLLRDREHLRHLKAVDAETGRVVGYVRWALPDSRAADVTSQREPSWADAQVPALNEQDAKAVEEAAQKNWMTYKAVGNLDDILIAKKNEIMAQQDFISQLPLDIDLF